MSTTDLTYTGQVDTSAEEVQAQLDRAEEVARRLDPRLVNTQGLVVRAQVVLMPLDTAWNPASTRTVLHGPGVVTYTRYPDGGVTATLSGGVSAA
jgi:hypothetical protein